MNTFQIGNGGFCRRMTIESKVRPLYGRHHGSQTLGPFGVSGTRAVLDHVRVGEQ